MDRKLKRAAKNHHKRKAKNNPFADLIDSTEDFKQSILYQNGNPERLIYFGNNECLSVQIFKLDSGLEILGFRRNTENRDIPFQVKQYFKEKLFPGKWGIETFPPADQLIDSANIYWLAILDEPVWNFKGVNLF